MLYTNNFTDAVLFDPIKQGADKLKIVSGYASPAMASWHMTEIAERHVTPIEIALIVGMCKSDGLSVSAHEGFKNVMNGEGTKPHIASSFCCQYVTEGTPVHSKIYVWERNGEPITAYTGSANYSHIAFSRSRREVMQKCDPVQALEYFNTIEANSIYCTHAEIEEHIQISRKPYSIYEPKTSPIVDSVKLSLLTRKGEIPPRSGINWGQRKEYNREPNQAYIAVPSKIAKSGFFPV